MRTTKPISSVWFGPDDWLKFKMDDLVKRGEMDFYALVHHYAEEDEKKEHSHFYCIPSKRTDTNALRDYLTLYDPANPLPIVPLPFKSSKFDDWYLYSIHDAVYLASKGQERKYHYKYEDVQSSDDKFLHELVHEVNYAKYKTQDRVKALAEQGVSFASIVSQGIIPVQQINSYRVFYEMVVEQFSLTYRPKTNRNGNEGHDEYDDLPF